MSDLVKKLVNYFLIGTIVKLIFFFSYLYLFIDFIFFFFKDQLLKTKFTD